jgi:hypothetical protein
MTVACLGDTLVLNRPTGSSRFSTTPFKDLFISCIPIDKQEDPQPITVLASGPASLTWTVAGIDETKQCYVSYGPLVSDPFGGDIYSWIRIVPRPTPVVRVLHPCTNCLPGQFSTASGATNSSTCVACALGTYATEQQATVCASCPSNSNTSTTGNTQRGGCLCNAGFVGNLTNLLQGCVACPANSYCAGLSQFACPANTRSAPQSSLQVQCRCVAGYRCRYGRDVQLVLRFSLTTAEFALQESAIRSRIASLAGVPVSGVLLQSTLAGGRRMLEVTAYVAGPGNELEPLL